MAKRKEYWDYETAKEFVTPLGLKSRSDWEIYKNSTEFNINLPKNPEQVYKITRKIKNFTWGDFLGNKNVANQNKNFWSYETAIQFVNKLSLKSRKEYEEYTKSIDFNINLPKSPETVYKIKNFTWGDFLGTKKYRNKKYWDYEVSKNYILNLNIKSKKEWVLYSKSNDFNNNIPKNPELVYKKNNTWISWGDFLGTDYVALYKRNYIELENLKEFARNLNIKSKNEWVNYCKSGKKPKNIPSNPRIYENWISWGDFLDTGRIANKNKKYKEYNEAKKCIKKLDIKTKREYAIVYNNSLIISDIPKSADIVYKDKGWISWPDFLGEKFETLEEALAYCMKNNITNAEEYYKHWEENPDCKLPYNLKKYYNLEDK